MSSFNSFLIRGFEIINAVFSAIIALVVAFAVYYPLYYGFGNGFVAFILSIVIGAMAGIMAGGLIATFIETRKMLVDIRNHLVKGSTNVEPEPPVLTERADPVISNPVTRSIRRRHG